MNLPAAGAIDLEVTSLGRDGARPRLAFLGRDCRDARNKGLRDWRNRRMTWVDQAGTYFVAVRADGTPPRVAYRLQVGYADRDKVEEDTDEWDEDSRKVEEDTDEWDEDSRKVEEDTDEWDEDSRKVEEDTDEWDEDSLVWSGGRLVAICPRAGFDLAGETHACGRRLPFDGAKSSAATVAGRIGAVTDRDAFSFELSTHETVVLGTRGALDTYGELFDAAGRRLAAAEDGGPGANFRLVASLAPGRYFLRIEGSHGSRGPYRLRAESRSRLTPGLRTALGAGDDHGDDHGDHCRLAGGAGDLVTGASERLGDVDVFRLDGPREGALLVVADDPSVRLELKAADCRSSLAAGKPLDGAVELLARPGGAAYLYVSRAGGATGPYRLALGRIPDSL